MAISVSVPKNLSAIKTKVALNLTKRQLICFGAAAACGVPLYFVTKGTLGTQAASLLMVGVMLPFFFLAMYEKDGLPFEKVMGNILRQKFLYPAVRPYRTENFYAQVEDLIKKEGVPDGKKTGQRKAGAPPGSSRAKKPPGKKERRQQKDKKKRKG